MSLKILIIHESRVITRIIRDYLFTDHPDAVIDIIDDPVILLNSDASNENTGSRIEKTAFDLVFSGLEMSKCSGLHIKDRLLSSAANSDTPFIIMTPTDTPELRERLIKKGVKHVLSIPCTSIQFRELLYNIFNPSPVTEHTLYTIPNSRAVIKLGSKEIDGEIINISTDSIVCEIKGYTPKELEKAQKATIQFPADYGKASTINISGDLDGLREPFLFRDTSTQSVKITWKIKWKVFELNAATKKTLQLFLGRTPFSSPGLLNNLVKDLENINKETQAQPNKENETSLKSQIEIISAENKVLHEQIEALRKKISELENMSPDVALKEVSLSALMNEIPEPSDDGFKLSIFKKVIEDNIKLREN